MRVDWRRAVGLLAVSTVLMGACAKSDNRNNNNGDPTLGDMAIDPNPVNPDGTHDMAKPLPPLAYAGVYAAPAPIDFTQMDVLPGLTSPLLGLFATIHTKPGTALVTLGQAANIKFLNDIGSTGRLLLSTLLDSVLGDLYTKNPGLEKVVTLIQNIGQIAKTTVLENKLTVHAPGATSTVFDLEVTGATFHFIDVNLVDTTFTTATSAASAAAAKTTFTMGSLTPHANPALADADISFDGGTVDIPMGDYLMGAIGVLAFKPLFGISDFKAGLVSLVPCDSMSTDGAAAVAACGTGVVCDLLKAVVTKALLKTLCDTVVGSAADQVIVEFQKLQVKDVTITSGRGVLYDISTPKPTADRQSDRVGDGTWTWTFGTAAVPSSFAGDRIP